MIYISYVIVVYYCIVYTHIVILSHSLSPFLSAQPIYAMSKFWRTVRNGPWPKIRFSERSRMYINIWTPRDTRRRWREPFVNRVCGNVVTYTQTYIIRARAAVTCRLHGVKTTAAFQETNAHIFREIPRKGDPACILLLLLLGIYRRRLL